MSIKRGMDKDVSHIYDGILLIHEKEINCAICRDIGGPRESHSEWRCQKQRQIFPVNTYMWTLEKLYR